MRTLRRAGAALLALTSLVAGCAGRDDKRIERSQLPKLVLQSADLARVWVPFDTGRQAHSDAPGDRADPRRFGREDGWKARYRRSGSPSTAGALVIESRADLFESEGGANAELRAYREQLEDIIGPSGGSARLLDEPALGDQAVAFTRGTGERPGVRYFTIAWRERNVTASLVLSGFEGRLTFPQALLVARKQQARIARS